MANSRRRSLCVCVVAALIGGSLTVPAWTADSPLTLESSDGQLTACFAWAKKQALAYAHEGDPVGLWYEAALPGRAAFCMRDVSHQAMGAHALGLAAYTRNMLAKFAANISASKDWCSYWEINRYDKPAPVDYTDDKAFWYNLPANFDVLDACYRMYVWTHDKAYLEDPVFLAFYRHTVTDYVERWDLGLDKVLARDRFMNRDSFDRRNSHEVCRGIPSYHEGSPGKTRLGIDQLAFQVAAYRSYSHLCRLRGDGEGAMTYLQKSMEVMQFIEEHFWNGLQERFNELLLTDGQYVPGGGMQVYVLYNDAVAMPDMTARTIRALAEGGRVNIELASHYPEILYHYGAHDDAYRWLLQISDPGTARREYPEVSFAAIGAIVNGLMGIEPLETAGDLSTQSRLTDATAWVKLSGLPVHDNVIDVRHNGTNETVLTNRSGGTINWTAKFAGAEGQLFVDNAPLDAHKTIGRTGEPLIWGQVAVRPGATVTITRTMPN